MPTRAIPYALVTVVLWASAFVAIRVAVDDYGAGPLSVARLVVASLALVPVAVVSGVRRPDRADLGRIVTSGLLGMMAYQLLLNSGQRSVPAVTAALLVATAPVITAIASTRMFGERLGGRWWGVGIAGAGAALVAFGRTSGGLAFEPAGLLVLGAAISQAGYFVVQKPLLARYTAVEATCHAMWAGTVCALPFGWGVPSAIGHAPANATLAVVWLGVAASAVGFVSWASALRISDAGRLTTMLYLVAPTAAVIGWATLDEVPSRLTLIGGAVTLTGVALVNALGRTRPRSEHRAQPLVGPSTALPSLTPTSLATPDEPSVGRRATVSGRH